MSLDLTEVRRIAALAELELDEAEERRIAEQLGRVVEYFDQLAGYEVAEDPADGEAPEDSNPVEREDRPAACLERHALLANAPRADDAFIVVPRVKVTE